MNKKIIIALVGFFLIIIIATSIFYFTNNNYPEIEKNCVLWFDGCNYCEVDFSGSLICTEIYCSQEEYEQPNCKVFLEDTNQKNILEKDFSEKYHVGYCPTMKEEAIFFKETNKNVELIEFNSAENALISLKNKDINMVIIGRRAKTNEINSTTTQEIKKSGFTLIFEQKVLIDTIDLPKITVHTHHLNYPTKYFSKEQIITHTNLEETLKASKKNKQPALITWEEYNNELEIIVVMNSNTKNKDFRGIFYYTN